MESDDYTILDPSSVTFPAATTSSGDISCVIITIQDDTVVENDELFNMDITIAPMSIVRIGLPSSSSVTIHDNDCKSGHNELAPTNLTLLSICVRYCICHRINTTLE